VTWFAREPRRRKGPPIQIAGVHLALAKDCAGFDLGQVQPRTLLLGFFPSLDYELLAKAISTVAAGNAGRPELQNAIRAIES
jgi:hypothetical protein